MKEQLVTFKTAIIAKEKGFDEPCGDFFEINKQGKIKNSSHGLAIIKRNNIKLLVSIPTQSLLQKWLRDVHDIHILVIPDKKTDYNNGKLFFNCTVKVNSKDYDYDLIIRYQSKIAEYNIYELALEAVLLEALKWIK